MRGNQFGKMLSITSFGESHGDAIGVIVDGVPAKLDFCIESLAGVLLKRAPGKQGTSDRVEKDEPQILSGIFEGKTLGTPIAVVVPNRNQRSKDYDPSILRPGHADKTTIDKYGIRDHRGGGRSSGRETISRVIGGYFASLIIPSVSVCAQIISIGGRELADYTDYLEELKAEGESAGAKISIRIDNLPAGLGEPCFDKLKADLGRALLSIGGCVSFSYGKGEEFSMMKGSQVLSEDFSGIEGGISNGDPIELTCCFKPPSTHGKQAKSGRHDPCIAPRVLPVAEAMVLLVLADHYLRQRAYAS